MNPKLGFQAGSARAKLATGAIDQAMTPWPGTSLMAQRIKGDLDPAITIVGAMVIGPLRVLDRKMANR